MAYRQSVHAVSCEGAADIIELFDAVTADGVVTPEEHQMFDAKAFEHYGNCERAELAVKKLVSVGRTGETTVWHARLERSIEKQLARTTGIAQAK